MPSISNIAISTIALLASIQYCPAPSAVAKAGIGGITDIIDSIGGLATTIDGIVKNHEGNKRDLVSFNSRINRRDYGLGTAPQDCQNQLHGAYVTFSQPSSNSKLYHPHSLRSDIPQPSKFKESHQHA